MDDTQIEMLPMLGEFSSIASQYEHIMFYYESGIQQIVAKLQILNNEFKNNHERNPIENIKSRVKSLDSIIDKMKRKGIPLTTNAMKREIKDIAGVRVICPFISDVYQVANMLVNQADVEIVTKMCIRDREYRMWQKQWNRYTHPNHSLTDQAWVFHSWKHRCV